MKYIFFALIALVCIGSSFSGCQKEDLGNLDGIFSDTTQAGPVAQMTARINNMPWEATSYNVTLFPGSPGQIVITGQSDNGQTIDLVVNSSKAGDYLLTRLSSHTAWYSPDSTDVTLYKSNATFTSGGVINIDSIDTLNQVISGEFNFIGGIAGSAATQTITDGAFVNLGYINSTANTQFGAKVNGNVWNPTSVSANISANNMLTITPSDANGQKMLLTFPANIKASKVGYALASTGNYTAAFEDNSYTLVPDAASKYNVPKLACSLKISSNTTTGTRNVKGTFSFYAVNSSDLTQKGSRIASGVFNVNY